MRIISLPYYFRQIRKLITSFSISLFLLVIFGLVTAHQAFAQAKKPILVDDDGSAVTAKEENELAKDANTEINVKNADIAAIVRIFSRKTKRNYILDERVKGKVSIYLPGKVTAEESVRILDTVLGYKGFSAVPVGDNIWKILPAKDAKQSTIPTQVAPQSGKPSSAVVTRLVQLKYVSSDEVKQLLSQLISPDGYINSYPSTNSLVIIDGEDNIERLVGLISSLDVSSSDRDMTIIPIQHAEAVDIAEKLNEILGLSTGKGSASSDGSFDLVQARSREAQQAALNRAAGNQPPGAPGVASAAGSQITAVSKQPKIIPDERTNSVIVVADENTTARVRALISELDSKLDLSGNRFYVYRCKHASADELVDVLSGLTGQGTGTSGRRSGTNTGLLGDGSDQISGNTPFGSSSRRNTSTGSSNYTQDRLRSQQRTPGQSRTGGNNRGSAGVSLGEDISISSDPATNSLIIVANKTDYQKILSLLEQLDIKRRQVLVEAMLLEVGLDDSQKMSTAFLTSGGGADGAILAQNNGDDIASLLSNPSSIQDFSLAAASKGTLTIGGGDSQIVLPSQTILLNAAKSNSNVNILSAPTILTTDNEQAEIVVGQNVPFLASTATSDTNLNNTFNQIDRQDVGITLRLTPQISAGEAVTLKIFTEVSSVASTDDKLGPTTSIRTSETSVITKDNQMIVIGGLMADDINQVDSGVPYLKDIPVLGHLFRTSSEKRRRTNLLILITPRIVKDQYDARDLTIERRDGMEEQYRKNEIFPSREEVLHNEHIDKVSENTPFKGEAPSTIIPPESAEKTPAIEPKAAAPTVEILTEMATPTVEPPSITPPEEAPVAQPTVATAVYLLLKVEDGSTPPKNTPFSITTSGRLIGVIIPDNASTKARQFFAMGLPYSYRIGSKEIRLVPVGMFSSEQEARQMAAEPDLSWYTLSPYELSNLGNGPWLKVK